MANYSLKVDELPCQDVSCRETILGRSEGRELETFPNNSGNGIELITKHCQRYNGPKGFTKITAFKFMSQVGQNSASDSRPNFSFKTLASKSSGLKF